MKKFLALISMIVATTAFAADVPNLPRRDGTVDPRAGFGPRGGGFAMQMDADRDGKVTKQEMLAWFEKADTDKDGVLTQEELASVRPGPRAGQGGPPEGRGPQGGQQGGPQRNRQGGQRPQ